MHIRHPLTAAALATVLGGLMLPAYAEARDGSGGTRDQAVHGMHGRDHMDHRMMSRGDMPGGMMSGGCTGMMQSMSGGDGRPNSQWRVPPSGGATSE